MRNDDKNIKVKNIIEYEILDNDGNIVKKNRVENTDTLLGRCIVSPNPQNYLTCGLLTEDPKEKFGLADINEVYKYFKVNYNFAKNFSINITSSFSKIDNNSISTLLTYSNITGQTINIYAVISYSGNRDIAYTYYLFDPPEQLLNGYTLNLRYYIYIEKYVSYETNLLSSSKTEKNTSNDILESVVTDEITREYKYTRAFTKTRPYLGLDTSDYSATVSAPRISINSNHPENKSGIISSNQENDYHTFELYFRFLEDGDVNTTNALLFGGWWFYNNWYKEWYGNSSLYRYSSNSLFYIDKFKNKKQMCYDPLITDYTNAYIVYSDGSYKRIKTGHYDPNTGEFTETGESIQLKPLKRSIIDFPLVDGVNTLKEFFKLCLTNVNYDYAIYLGISGNYSYGYRYAFIINTWLTTFYSNIDKQLKYYLHWDSSETDPYFYIVTNKEISQIDFNGTVVDNTTITPFYHETVNLSEPYPKYYVDGWKTKTQMDIYIYKIHLSDYIDISTNRPCKVIVSFTSQPQIVFCYKSNCYVYAIECDEKLVNTNDTTGEDVIICRSVYKSCCFGDNYHKVKQFPETDANNYVAQLTNNAVLYQHPNNGNILETPQLCFGSIIFNNTKLLANQVVTIKDNSNVDKFQVYWPVGNIIKDLDNNIVHVFGHTYWPFHAEYLTRQTNISGNWFTHIFENVSNMFITFENKNLVNIILPLMQPSYLLDYYYLYNIGAYPNMYKDRLKNFDVIACRSEIESQTIDLFGKQFKMYVPITENFQIGRLEFNFQNADVSPTFIEKEFLGIPCCNKWLITDSLEKWLIMYNDSKLPENNPYHEYLEDYSANVVFYSLSQRSEQLPNLTNIEYGYDNYDSYVCMPFHEIEIPDEQYLKWNTLYTDPQGNILKYRILYFLEDIFAYHSSSEWHRRQTLNILLMYPKRIATSEGEIEIEPELVLLNNSEEVPFSFSDNPGLEKLEGFGYIRVHLHKYRFWDHVYWRQKNNFLIYVYFKKKTDPNPFIREFTQALPPDTNTIEGLMHHHYGGNKFKLTYNAFWYGSDNSERSIEIFSYPINIEEKSQIFGIEDRNKVFRWLPIQMPAFMKLIDPVIVCNFGEDEKTLYEHFNVNPSDTNNIIIPKTFYLDAQDFGENNYQCLQNVKDNDIDKEILVYFGWAYEPENRPANDLTLIYPIIKIDKIRNILGDNFKITDLDGNELEWWYVTGEEYYTDTHTISTIPTDYIMINTLGRTPRNYGSGYSDTRGGNYTDDSHYTNNIIMSFSYTWDRKNKQDFIYKESNWRDNLNIQPYKYWDYDPNDEEIFYNAPNFRMSDCNYNMHRNKNPEIIFHVCPESTFHYSNNPGYWVGKPYPIPGFLPSFWLDYIMRHNKPNIALDVIKITKDSTSHNQTTTPSINGKIVDSQLEIEKPDLTGRVKVYHQTNRKLVKQDVKYIYSVAVHEFNKHYNYCRRHPNYGWAHKTEEYHKIRYIVTVENQDESVRKYYHYDQIYNKWVDVTDKISNDEDLINYGFNKFELEMYGHKLNELLRDYMSDTDKLSFTIAIKNESPTVTVDSGNITMDFDNKDEYSFVEIWGISIEAEFNDTSYYREIPWCWIDLNTKQLITDISGKNQNEVTTVIKCVPTHWIIWEITDVGNPDNTIFKDPNRFYQLPLKIYIYHSSFTDNGTSSGHTMKFIGGWYQRNHWMFLDNYKDDWLLRDDIKI